MHYKRKGLFKLSILWMAMVPIFFIQHSNKVQSREFFDPLFIRNAGDENSSALPDLSIYETKYAQAPGSYRVDVIFNGHYLDTKNINFIIDTSKNSTSSVSAIKLKPCFSQKELSRYGVKVEAFPELKEDNNNCANLSIIPDTTFLFDFTSQRLNISIPQAALSTLAQDYIAPEEFDDGINALFMNYQFSGANDSTSDDENYNLNLQSGLNIGPWRLRNLSIWSKNKGEESTWDSAYLYLQRSINSLKSSLVIGESSSLSNIFDSVPFTGIQLATDTSMRPESMRGYAPVIRGIAKTNARVVIKQNGYQVYQTFVAPGAFEITDMYPSGGSGDLYVTVEESDGTIQNFVVPFSTLPVMIREGQVDYEITTGKYRSYNGKVHDTPFTQSTATYGFSSISTVYGGLQVASHYQSISMGIGYSLGEIGAASVDVTQAWSKKQDENKTSGQSWRIRYGKNILETGTNISIAGYRYSTKGFNTLSEVLDTYSGEGTYNTGYSLRNRTNLTINQSLGNSLGSISISGIFEDYWNNNRKNKSLSIGYNGGWKGINYYLGYSYSRYSWNKYNSNREVQDDQRVNLTITIPLSNWLPGSYASYHLTDSNPGSTDQSVTLGGVALENDSLNWSIQQGYSNREYYSSDLRGNYSGSHGDINAGYSYNNDSSRIDYGVSGSIVAHADGITFGQEINEAAALIIAPGLEDVRLTTDPTISTDARGYAIVPYLTAYRRTDVALDSTTLGDNVELPETMKKVVPTRGAIVRANFKGNIGLRAFVHLKTITGKDVPFGAMVSLDGDPTSQPSIVSDAGLVYMTGLQQAGILNVQWGKGDEQQCKAPFNLPPEDNKVSRMANIVAICRR